MDYQKYADYLKSIVPGPWLDQIQNPVNVEEYGDFVTFERAWSVKALFEKQLTTSGTLAIDSRYSSKDQNQRWILTYLAPDGSMQTTAIGDIIAEMSDPDGWAHDDGRNFYIGYGAPGHFVWLTKMASSSLMFEWVPDAKPKPAPASLPGSTTTTWGDLSNASNGFDNGSFTNADRTLLIEIAKRIGIK